MDGTAREKTTLFDLKKPQVGKRSASIDNRVILVHGHGINSPKIPGEK